MPFLVNTAKHNVLLIVSKKIGIGTGPYTLSDGRRDPSSKDIEGIGRGNEEARKSWAVDAQDLPGRNVLIRTAKPLGEQQTEGSNFWPCGEITRFKPKLVAEALPP